MNNFLQFQNFIKESQSLTLTKATNQLLSNHSSLITTLLSSITKSTVTFDNFLLPLSYSNGKFTILYKNIDFFQEVAVSEKIRSESLKNSKRIEKYKIEMSMREDIYEMVKEIMKKEGEMLKGVKKRYIERIINDGKRNGLDLDEKKKKKRICEVKKEIKNMEMEFMKNIREDKSVFEFEKSELDGMKDDFIENLKKSDDGKKVKVTLKYPDLIPCLKMCKVVNTRRVLEDGRCSKGQDKNTELYEKTIQRRQELAKLLGFKSFPDFSLDIKIAKTPSCVYNFLNTLKDRLFPLAKKELKDLELFKQKDLGLKDIEPIKYYDFAFYQRFLKEKKLQLDENLLQEYFPLNHVVKCTLEILEFTFGLKFEERKGDDVWHEDVKKFRVFDDKNNILGEFYLDLFPRDGKYSHGGVYILQPSAVIDVNGKKQQGVAAMLCNFTKKTDEKPSLLRFNEVETFFHEMGHILHVVCSQTYFSKFSGYLVEVDFLEFPSQLLENWCFEKEVLKKISSHYKTGEVLSDELIDKVIESRKFKKALEYLSRITMSLYDIESYRDNLDSQKLYNKLQEEIFMIKPNPKTNRSASFIHLMCDWGYEVGYYSYLFSEVYSIDGFSLFKKNGIFSKETQLVGKRFLDVVLKTGADKDGKEILKEFLQREPNNEAFFELLSIN